MNVIVDATIRSSGLLILGLAVAACLGRRPAAVRHCVLAAAIFAAAVVAPLSLLVPSWAVAPLPQFTASAVWPSTASQPERLDAPAAAVVAAAPAPAVAQ